MFKYGNQLERIFGVFPREKVYILPFSDLKANTSAAMTDLFTFLGVDPNPGIDYQVYNPSKKIRSSTLQWLFFDRNSIACKVVSGFLPQQLKLTLVNKLRELNSKPGKRKPMQPLLRNAIYEEYKQDIRKLEGLLGRKFNQWK